MKVFLTILAALWLFYANTADVQTSRLVFKPLHGFIPFYNEGEEGRWQRDNPGKPLPWWLLNDYKLIADVGRETTVSPVRVAYIIGYFLTLAGSAIAAVLLPVIWLTRRRRSSDASAELPA